MKATLRTGLLYAGVIALVFWLGGWWRAQGMVAVGSPLAPITLQDLEGGWHPLPASGAPQLLYLFAPWCLICDLTLDGVNDLHQAHPQIRPVALAYDDIEQVRAFVGPKADPAGVLLGTPALGRDLGVQAFPSYLLVDAQGQIVAKRSGYMPGWMLRLYLRWYAVI